MRFDTDSEGGSCAGSREMYLEYLNDREWEIGQWEASGKVGPKPAEPVSYDRFRDSRFR